jgi:hypothetical protein
MIMAILYSIKTNRNRFVLITGEQKMGRMRENPRYNVISMRISDEERMELETLVSITDKSVSGIMREAMDLFKSKLELVHIQRSIAA